MKIRMFPGIFVSFLLLAFAQSMVAQSNPSPSTAPDNQSQSARQPLPPDKPKDFWDGDDPNLGNLLIHPFATKTYVKRHTEPIRDRLNELDSITSENSRAIKEVDSRAQQGLQMASEKESLADQHSTDAATKAQGAQSAATQANNRVASAEQLVGNLDQYHGDAQTEIRFRPGQNALSKNAKDVLDQMAGSLKDQHSYIIEVRGFAPGHGSAAITSSQKMADSVVRYLVTTHQIPVYRIYVLSMGNSAVARGTDTAKHMSSARVEVNVLRNDVVAAAQH